MEMRRPRAGVAHVLERAFVTKAALRMLGLSPAEEQQHLIAILLVLHQQFVRHPGGLAVDIEIITVQLVVILRHIARFFLCNEKPDGLVVLEAEHASVDCGVVDFEFLAQVLASVNGA